jgi:hypothetical protein
LVERQHAALAAIATDPNQVEARSEYLPNTRRMTMSYPAVDDLPEEATCTMLDVCRQLSKSRHAGLARWAASVSDALLVRLVTVITGASVDVTDIKPCWPLAQLDAAELDGLYSVLLAGADASDDEAVIEWCTRMILLIDAEFDRRTCEQAAINAKAAAIEAEEWRLVRQALPVADRYCIRPWSRASPPPQ